ncbi:hypothetical protein BC941DRAFT_444655 [Chlamydoabsidia padenii]|nr:hypothetical protein BC941DRAFT_444655 [Chlamydoabsidia padenii]
MKSVWFILSWFLLTVVTGQDPIQLKTNFRSSPKNIIFGAFIPGSSHVTWVLRFLDELALRGHNVTFLTMNENLKFGKSHPRLNTMSINNPKVDMESVLNRMGSNLPITEMLPLFIQILTPIWRPGFETTLNLIESTKADVVICDHFSEGCIDAVRTKNLPLVLTSTMAIYPDAATSYFNGGNMLIMSELTTHDQSILKRLYDNFYLPLKVFPKIKPYLDRLAEIKRQAGLANPSEDPSKKTRHALKIVSTVFGLEVSRPIGPLVELVGPLFSSDYQPLDETFGTYLDSHQQVAYVAFGQHAKPRPSDVTLVLTALIHQYEKGHIDGIIWSSGNAHVEKFPATLTSRFSGKTYDIASLFQDSASSTSSTLGGDLFITKWSPQMAVLLHPSVSVFISHGGANSLMESLYAQKRLIFYPFFGDQPGVAKHLSQSGLSEWFDYSTDSAEIDARVEKVILDVNGTYQANVKRYQALVQIHSKAAPSRAADLVEEAAFSTDGSRFLHREDVGDSLSFMKRYNLDLYAIVLVLVTCVVGLVSVGAYTLARRVFASARTYQKTKTL